MPHGMDCHICLKPSTSMMDAYAGGYMLLCEACVVFVQHQRKGRGLNPRKVTPLK